MRMKNMKKTFGAILCALILILIIPHFIDWSHFRQPIITAFKKHTGFDVDFKGPIHFTLLPTIHLSADEICVKNRPGGTSENFITLKKIFLKADLLSLLKGKINISQVELIEPAINLETSSNGQNNWELKTEEDHDKKDMNPATHEPEEEKKLTFSLQKIYINNGKGVYKNLAKKSSYEVSDIHLDGSLSSLTGRLSVEGHLNFNNHTFTGTIDTESLTGDKASPLNADISVSKDGEDYGSLTLRGTVHNKKFAGTLQSAALKIPITLNTSGRKIDLKQGIHVFANVEADPENIKVSNLDMKTDTLKLTGTGAYTPSLINGQFTVTDKTSKLDVSLNGQSNEDYLWDGSVSLNSQDPSVFLEWTGIDSHNPSLKGPLNVSTHLRTDSMTYAFESLKFKIGHFEGSGTASIKTGARLFAKSDISLNKLDLNSWLETAQQNKNKLHDKTLPSNASVDPAMRWSQEKWNLESLNALDMECKFNVAEFIYDDYKLTTLKGALSIKDGQLNISHLQALGYGGTISGNAYLSQGKSHASKLNLEIKNLNMASLPEAKRTSLKKATLNTSVHLSATGHSPWEIIHSLAGDIHLNVTQGVIEAFGAKKFINDLKHVKNPSDVKALVESSKHKSETAFAHINGDFKIHGGKASSQNINFESEDLTATAKGSISLPNWTLSMDVLMKIKNVGNIPSIPMHVQGDLSSPSYDIDAGLLTQLVLKDAVNRLVDKATKGVSSQISGLIKGVIGTESNQNKNPQAASTATPKKAEQTLPLNPEKILKSLFG